MDRGEEAGCGAQPWLTPHDPAAPRPGLSAEELRVYGEVLEAAWAALSEAMDRLVDCHSLMVTAQTGAPMRRFCAAARLNAAGLGSPGGAP